MTTFAQAARNQMTRTQNNMKARVSSANSCVDLFFQIGASRGKDIIPAFVAAYTENKEHALRIVQWARDVRGGSGERQLFRNILLYLEKHDPDSALLLAKKTPELGRWDDLLVFQTPQLKEAAFAQISEAITAKNGLAAKWMPRKGKLATELREYLGLTPRGYRKTLVNLTKVVETQMCAKQWDEINFSHVPSLASARYKKAFTRHTPKFAEYVQALVKGDPNVKVNTGAVYPYDVLKGLMPDSWGIRAKTKTKTELDHITAQWNALPNYVGDANVLAVVDVSGSMTCKAGGHNSKSELTCLEVAVSLGLYVADKNKGKFKDTFLNFTTRPKLHNLTGDIVQKIHQMNSSDWAGSTNLHAAIQLILDTGLQNQLPEEEMPDMLLIMSDMQFNQCVRHDDSAIEMMRRKYENAGYKMPQIVFWNLNAYDNTPVSFKENGTALVSGFSPTILTSLLGSKLENFTPYNIMLEAIMKPRYDI